MRFDFDYQVLNKWVTSKLIFLFHILEINIDYLVIHNWVKFRGVHIWYVTMFFTICSIATSDMSDNLYVVIWCFKANKATTCSKSKKRGLWNLLKKKNREEVEVFYNIRQLKDVADIIFRNDVRRNANVWESKWSNLSWLTFMVYNWDCVERVHKGYGECK